MNKIVELKDIYVSIEGKIILENINLEVNKGDTVIIIGPNGGGKTTLLKVITGQIKPDKGMIKLFGEKNFEKRELIGYVPQHIHLDFEFPVSVYDVVLMGRYGKIGFFKKTGKTDKETVLNCIDLVGLSEYQDYQIGKLSGGQQQRVFIARALANNPGLLILDEPTTGIDAKSKDNFYRLISKLQSDLSLTVILVSHEIEVIPKIADKIVCLNRMLFFHGKPEKVFSEGLFKQMYGCELEFFLHGKVPHRVVHTHKNRDDKK